MLGDDSKEKIVPTNSPFLPIPTGVPPGVPPPAEARVGYAQEDAASDMSDVFEAVPGGEAAPETPRAAPETPRADEGGDEPMEVAQLRALSVTESDPDVDPVLNLLQADEELKADVLETNVEILRLVMQLGGPTRAYRRERARAIRLTVSEIYSAPRVTRALKMLPSMNLQPGFALDLTGEDEEGNAWDFTQAHMREKARKKVDEEEPTLLIGSPGCTPYSSWQALNAGKHGWPEGEVERRGHDLRCSARGVHHM